MTGEVGTCLQMVPTASLMCGLREGMQFSAGISCEVDSQNDAVENFLEDDLVGVCRRHPGKLAEVTLVASEIVAWRLQQGGRGVTAPTRKAGSDGALIGACCLEQAYASLVGGILCH